MLNRISFSTATAFCVLFSLFTTPSHGATFTYYNGGFIAQTSLHAQIDGIIDDRSREDISPSMASLYTNAKAESINGYVEASSGADGGYSFFNFNELNIGMGTFASINTDILSGLGTGESQVSVGTNDFIFFQITPESGEAYGDRVNVTFDWFTYQDWTITDADTILTSANAIIQHNGETIWSHETTAIDRSEGFFQEYGLDLSFAAQIGDIIGFNMDVGAQVASDFDGLFAGSQQELYMKAEAAPVPIPGAFLLFGSGLAGLAALRRNKKMPMWNCR